MQAPARAVLAAFLALAPGVAAAQQPDPGGDPAACAPSAAEAFRRAAPSVVQVMAFGVDPFRVMQRVRGGVGSGVALGDDLILTNFHVVADATAIGATGDGVIVEAEVIARDPALDIAVLRAPGLDRQVRPIDFAPVDDLEVGAPVYVVGYPLGVGKSISAGIVSGLDRVVRLNTQSWLSPYIQTDAAVSGGNSGGAMVDGCGRMIGMVTLRSNDPAAENLSFAIPAATILDLLPELVSTGKVARAWHGIYGQIVSPPIQAMIGMPFLLGFLVETVEPGSAADRAGIRGGTLPVRFGMQEFVLGGDVITSVDGAPIETIEDAIGAVRSLEIGQTVEILLLRNGLVVRVSAVIEERPILDRDIEPYRAPH